MKKLEAFRTVSELLKTAVLFMSSNINLTTFQFMDDKYDFMRRLESMVINSVTLISIKFR